MQELRPRAFAALVAIGAVAGAAMADEQSSASGLQLQEVTVTARRIEENLQKVPDSITVFTGSEIVDFGIKTIDDFASLTSNFWFHSGDGYEPGSPAMVMRGIGQTIGGWPGVSYIVDGVPLASIDSIQKGWFGDIERIEVLRGPQSALYGFNAIAGAVNVISKRPTNDWNFAAELVYANGNDRQVGGTVSGPIISDTLLFRLNAAYRDSDGLITSASNGLHLDFQRWWQAAGKLLFTPTSNFELQLVGNWTKEDDGSTWEDKVPSPVYADNFDTAYNARRAFRGVIDRDLYTIAAHMTWDLDHFSLIGTVGFDRADHVTNSSACFDDPNDPVLPAGPSGGAQCYFGPAFGNAAPPGQPIDNFFYERGDIKTITADVRAASRGTKTLEWTVGFATLHRDALGGIGPGGLNAGVILAPNQTYETLFPLWGDEIDKWWGVYGQLIWHMTPRLDVTVAGRYDHETYDDTAYTDDTYTVVMPVYNTDGVLVDTQHESADAFQPKGQVSYHFTDDDMGYVTVSRGFRGGFYVSNAYVAPEHTTNYEIGLKSSLWNRRIVANTALFYIDYSNQQFYQFTAQPPFEIAVSVPKTKIKGAEFDGALLASRFVTFGLDLGYLNTAIANGGGWSPGTPRFNGTAYVDFTVPVGEQWNARLHVDNRYNSLQYLALGNTDENPAKDFVNIRAGVQNPHWDIAAFVRNATDRREQTQAGVEAAGGFIRFQNTPRSYGVEVRASF